MMFFLRWITGHPILSLLLLTLVYAVINWSNLHEWTAGDDSNGAEHSASVSADVSGDQSGTSASGHAASTTDTAAPAMHSNVAANNATTGINANSEAKSHTAETAVETSAESVIATNTEAEATTETRDPGLFGRLFKRGVDENIDSHGETASPAKAAVANTGEAISNATSSGVEVAKDVTHQAAELLNNAGSKATATVAATAAATAGAVKAVMPGSNDNSTASATANAEQGGEERKSLFGFFKKDQEKAKTEVAVEEKAVEEKTDAKAESKHAVSSGVKTEVVAATTTPSPSLPPAATEITASEKPAVVTEEKESAESEKKSLFGFFKKNKEAEGTAPEVPQADAQVALGASQKDTAVVTERHGDLRSSLQSARQAFWRRDFPGSSAIYENLVAANPGNPDLLGEYGNMLVQAGKPERAIDLYEKAAELLINQQRFNEVHPLVGFIGNINPERANRIVESLRNR